MKRQAAIIGAGIGGLGAAYELKRLGYNYKVFEAGSRPGGRVVSEVVDGFHIDTGANIFLESYKTVKTMAGELGVPLRRSPNAVHGGIYHGGKFHGVYGGDRLKDRLKKMKTFLSFQHLSPKGLWQARKFFKLLKDRKRDLSFDNHARLLDLDGEESVAEFFESKIGVEFLEKFVQPILSGFTLGYPEEVGLVYLMVASANFSGSWPYMPEGGLGTFMDALVKYCGEENILLSTPVERIVIEKGVVRGVETKDGFAEFDAVVCATTAGAVLNMAPDLSPDVRDVLEKVTYSKCCRVVFGVDSNPFPEKDWYALALPRSSGSLMAGMSNSAVLSPETVPKGKELLDAFVIGGRAEKLFALSDKEVKETLVREIRKYLPAMPPNPLFSRVYRWPEAVCLAPGGMMKAVYDMRCMEYGGTKGFFLAGGYMGVPSTNGALRSGLNAAEDCAGFFSESP